MQPQEKNKTSIPSPYLQSLCLVAFWTLTILKRCIIVDTEDSCWYFSVSHDSWIGILFSWLMYNQLCFDFCCNEHPNQKQLEEKGLFLFQCILQSIIKESQGGSLSGNYEGAFLTGMLPSSQSAAFYFWDYNYISSSKPYHIRFFALLC